MLNLDPALLDQDKIRLAKRKKLLLISIIPILILVLVAIFFGRTGVYNIFLSIEKNSNSYNVTSALNNFHMIGNIIDPYIPHYNKGYTTLINAKNKDDLVSAENYFRESLKNTPPESALCSIYGNLSYAIELQGDTEVSAGNYDSGIVFYNRAESLLYENGCASKDGDKKSKDTKAESAKDRISSKRRKAIASANDTTDDENGENNNTQVSEDNLEQIKESQQTIEENGVNLLRYRKGQGRGMPYTGMREPNF